MKKKMRNSNNSDMRDEYDFSGGVRGKHYKAYRKGHTVIVHKDDGSTSVQYFTQEDGSVMLDPDVKVHFPDSESVNKALRSLGEAVEEAAEEIEPKDRELLKQGVIEALEDEPDGLKMTQIAEMLGVENWRSLIPVMRELLAADELRKEDSVYYVVE